MTDETGEARQEKERQVEDRALPRDSLAGKGEVTGQCSNDIEVIPAAITGRPQGAETQPSGEKSRDDNYSGQEGQGFGEGRNIDKAVFRLDRTVKQAEK